MKKRPVLIFLGVLGAAVLAAVAAAAKDYLVVTSHPGNIHLIDVAAREVVRTMTIPGDGPPFATVLPPDGKTVYVLTNRLGSVAGIDLETGEQVFRADLSYGNVRVRSLGAMAISADGGELFIFQSRSRRLPAEYQELETRIAVYDTGAGLGAQPVRTFPAPRGILILLPAADGAALHAIGNDYYTLDPASGEIVRTVPLRDWDRAGLGPPDAFPFWPHYRASGVFTAPYGVQRLEAGPGSPEAFLTGIMQLDLASGELSFTEFEAGGPAIFSTVLNPVRRTEAYGVWTQLTKIDLAAKRVVKRVGVDRSYYNINISSDGEELFLAGGMDDILVYGSRDLERRAVIRLPGGGDQSLGSPKLVQW